MTSNRFRLAFYKFKGSILKTKKSIRIGNGAGFWGDDPSAPRRLADTGMLDYLTLEYLAELTLSILAYQRMKDPSRGFVADVPTVVTEIISHLEGERPLKLVTNGGGINPTSCVTETAKVLVEAGFGQTRLAAVAGDDLLDNIDQHISEGELFHHFETGEPLGDLRSELVSANAYMGAQGICDALAQQAQIVITGRVADASLVVGPAVHELGWSLDDADRVAAGTVAGHLIECGAQVTGGMYSKWHDGIDVANIGYPIAEISNDGNCVISKPDGSGGQVSTETVAEQLVYEIGDPQRYMTPDVVADFSQVTLAASGPDRVLVTGGRGQPAPDQFKVSMAYRDGYSTMGEIVIAGRDAKNKATAAAEAIKTRMVNAGFTPDQFEYEFIGIGATLPGVAMPTGPLQEIMLRMHVRDSKREALQFFTRQIPSLVTSGPPGVTGYVGARPKIIPVLAYWPSTIDRNKMQPNVQVKTAQEWVK